MTLAGSVWLPSGHARVGVVMHPGSGPSDRRNDGYFDAIREHLVSHGIAVAAFDKRGVGESSGRWQDAAIIEQADDVLSALEVVRGVPELSDVPIGLFGHSQGGWVVIEASARGTVSFVVCNSGPGVTPAAQERFALITALAGSGDQPAPHLEKFDRGLALARAGASYSEARTLADALHPCVPDDELAWQLWVRMLDYDPAPALRRLRVPLLALFGADDAIVPVSDSVAVLEELAPQRATVVVIPGANHRLQVGTPPRLADGYLETLTAFLHEQARDQGDLSEVGHPIGPGEPNGRAE